MAHAVCRVCVCMRVHAWVCICANVCGAWGEFLDL